MSSHLKKEEKGQTLRGFNQHLAAVDLVGRGIPQEEKGAFINPKPQQICSDARRQTSGVAGGRFSAAVV